MRSRLEMYELPLFPLNVVLFPGMPLPLHIFEDRYKEMIADCIRENRPFGVVLIEEGSAEHGPAARPVAIGCTAEIAQVQEMIRKHAEYTNSELGWRVLIRWDELLPKIVKVYPKDYKRMMEALAEVSAQGLSGEEAVMEAFAINKSDVAARVAGN